MEDRVALLVRIERNTAIQDITSLYTVPPAIFIVRRRPLKVLVVDRPRAPRPGVHRLDEILVVA